MFSTFLPIIDFLQPIKVIIFSNMSPMSQFSPRISSSAAICVSLMSRQSTHDLNKQWIKCKEKLFVSFFSCFKYLPSSLDAEDGHSGFWVILEFVDQLDSFGWWHTAVDSNVTGLSDQRGHVTAKKQIPTTGNNEAGQHVQLQQKQEASLKWLDYLSGLKLHMESVTSQLKYCGY